MINGKTYLYFLIGIVVTMAIVVVVYSAIQAGMFIGLLFGVVVLGIAVLFFSWATAAKVVVPLAELRLRFLAENHEHDRRVMEIKQKRLAPPKQRIQDTDPRRPDALKLLQATIRHPNYGPTSRRIISADDAQAAKVMNRSQRQDAIDLLSDAYHVYRIYKEGADNNGTYCPGSKTVQDLYEDMLSVNRNALDEAVMALPGAGR